MCRHSRTWAAEAAREQRRWCGYKCPRCPPRFSIRVDASSSTAGRVVSAVMPTEINHDRSVVGRKHAVNGIPRDDNRLDVDQLILMAGAEKDMIDALVDELRTGLKRSRWMC
jgi:hypothetical protein